ncbi:MAG: SpoIIIAC/SpoIIIAD family protein [bacterium]|nr:SpoIIIAC/SpoIIIAD family protein [bacterium]
MIIFKIALIGIAGAVLTMITKQFKPEYSTLVLFAVCLFLVGYLTLGLGEVLSFVQVLQKKIPVSSTYIKILFKLLAIAYVCQIASDLCEDLGYRSISFQIETIGKVSILLLSIPIIQSLLETVEKLLQ